MSKMTDEDIFVIKRQNSYICVKGKYFSFLDISQFIAAGSSYSSFLQAYNIKEKKSYFPYSYLTSYAVLLEEKLPDYESFYSKLKSCNVLEEEHDRWE